MGFDFTFAMSRYGDMWREKRRMLHKYVNHKVSPEYQGMQSHEAHKFVAKLLEDPQDFMTQVNQYVYSTFSDSAKLDPKERHFQVHHSYNHERRLRYAQRERYTAFCRDRPRDHGLCHRSGCAREILSRHHSR